MNEQELRLDIKRALDRRLEVFRAKYDPNATYRQVSINKEVDDLIYNHTLELKNRMHDDNISTEEVKRLGRERERIEERIRQIRQEVEEEVEAQ